MTVAAATPRTGVIRGATNIAPMTTAVESSRIPSDAMSTARPSRIEKRTR
jgi:hypothetical protein